MAKVLFFGSVAEIVGKTEQVISGSITIMKLISDLEASHPELKGKKLKISVDKKIVSDFNVILSETSEVALLPPFSGG